MHRFSKFAAKALDSDVVSAILRRSKGAFVLIAALAPEWIARGEVSATAFAPILFETGEALAPIATIAICAALLTAFMSVRTWYRNAGYAVTH